MDVQVSAYDVIKRVGPVALRRYPANYVHLPHRHADAEICCVLAGFLWERVGGETQQGGPGSILVRPADVVHSNRIGPAGTMLLNVSLAGALAHRVNDARIGVWRWLRSSLAARLTFHLAAEVIHEHRFSAIEAVLTTLAAEAARPQRARKLQALPPWVCRIRDRLHASVDRLPSVVELAESEGLHPVYLTRRFHEAYGTSVSGYLRRLRVFAGARRLLEGHDTLTTIAHELGFADQSHFCRSFQAALHMTPTQYRQLLLPYALPPGRAPTEHIHDRQVQNVQYPPAGPI